MQGEECDVIEISFMRAQRTRYLWLSRQDHLPRKLKEIVRGAETRVTVEEWSNVTVNAEIPAQGPHLVAAQGLAAMGPAPAGGFASAERARGSGFRAAVGPRRQDQAVGLSRPSRLALRMGRGIAPVPRGDPRLPAVAPGLPGQGPRDPRLQLHGQPADCPRLLAGQWRDASERPRSFRNRRQADAGRLRQQNQDRAAQLHHRSARQVVYGWFGHEQDPEQVLAALRKAGLGLAQ